jgi:hypothetical protein
MRTLTLKGGLKVATLDARGLYHCCPYSVWALWGSRFCHEATAAEELAVASKPVAKLWGVLGPGKPPTAVLVTMCMIEHFAVPWDVVYAPLESWTCPCPAPPRTMEAMQPAYFLGEGVTQSLGPAKDLCVLMVDADTREALRLQRQTDSGDPDPPLVFEATSDVSLF